MIDLYTFPTPNGRKVSIALEELKLPYTAKVVDILRGDQFKPEFLAINPNNKIPAIVDHDGADGRPITVFESGAILIYLAEKTGYLMPSDPRGKADVLQWLMFQMGGVGPMFGQYNHFTRFHKTAVPYAIERYRAESKRLLGVLDKQLGQGEYVARTYSIADIALYPWVTGFRDYNPELFIGLRHVPEWLHRVASRPAVQKGMAVPTLSK
ncbi:glutathione S-transferase family protein [Corallococcus sp. H22C18031201]|uniref:glutathione S-transferase family protein n=1 Tax=Citreicoccus inhibens TaxID=2849499 RepID=UPI000E750EB5|nr:glutathione S-transferase N-terminal domain-containing protein [Citreicoccus inhibens]MBU8898733.1 glutathione S-transferase N-terminal domain-containing protein [Citreicoccus inhibens]RJS24106.1 glutathione S-transferase family protein [Corallococcus sp. H22C18031201]